MSYGLECLSHPGRPLERFCLWQNAEKHSARKTVFDVDTYGGGAILIALFVIASLGLMLLVRRRVPRETVKQFHEVGGYYMSAVGTLYAIILGLVVVDSTNKFNEARTQTINESNALIEVYALAEKMPEPERQRLKKTIIRYAERALNEGWKEMQESRLDAEEERAFEDIMIVAREIEPVSENQKASYPLLLTALITAAENRAGRLDFEHYNLPQVEWVTLFAGAGATMIFTLFFAMDSLIAQAIMTGLLAFTLALNLYITFLFNTPYSGDLRVDREPLVALQRFAERYP